MKNVTFLLLAVLLSFKTWGGGGVDVGNYSPKSFKGSFQLPVFASEEAMIAHMQSILPAVEDGTYKEVHTMAVKGRCSKTEISFDELEVLTSYQYSQKAHKLNRETTGLVIVDFKECKRPQFVKNSAEF
jgi:hypothetical protein